MTNVTEGRDTAQVYREIVEIVASRTLYDESYLLPESHFEGELGIDSVILESIVASVKEHFGLRADLPAGLETLQDLVGAVEQALTAARPTARTAVGMGTAATAGGDHGDALLETVLRATMRHTLYERHQLDLDADFEGELGIDSVVLTSIIGDVAQELRLPDGLSGSVSATTLRALLAELRPHHTNTASGSVRRIPARDAARRPAETTWRTAEVPRRADEETWRTAEVPGRADETTWRTAEVPRRADEETWRTAGEPRRTDDAAWRTAAEPRRRTAGRAGRQVTGEAGRGNTERPGPRLRGPAAPPPGDTWDDRSMKDFMEQRDPDLFAKTRSFATYLGKREEEQLYWYGMPLRSRCENRAVIFDELTGREREFLMFASNNYLGLANHPRVVEAICDATRTYGATNTGCRIIGGTNHLHKELERRLAAFKQRPACIVFPGGYSANLGTISGLVKSYDAVIADKLNHMSIVDGCKLSGAVRKIYRHNDMADLERVLRRCGDQVMGKLIVTDGVFSMHGDVCDLPEIVRLGREYGAKVLVDDAHSTGVLGARGTGTAEHFGLKGQVDLELGTMSKTLAGMGGFVVGDEEVIEYLRFYANSYVFAATIPAGLAAGLIAAIDVIESEPERVEKLWSNIRFLRDRLVDAGFDLEHTESAILPIVIGDERTTMEMGRAVRARGLFCQTVVFPGVPLGDARLRVSVTSEHTVTDLELATDIFVDAARETGVLPAAGAGREPEAGRPVPASRLSGEYA